MRLPHVLALPYPAQGHVISLMELSHRLADLGFTVTFVNTEHNHQRLQAALPEGNPAAEQGRVRLAAIPDGLGPGDDRNDLGLLTAGLLQVMPGHLEELIRKTNESAGDGGEITCLVADQCMGWAFDVAKQMGLRSAVYWTASAAVLATILSIPKLIEDDVIDSDGRPITSRTFRLSPDMPAMDSTYLVWNTSGDEASQSVIYRHFLNNNRGTEFAEFIFCNSFLEVERPVFVSHPRILPVGPLLAGRHYRYREYRGHFWPEDDSSCTNWLDGCAPRSVVYAAFGSSTFLNPQQFKALALGLELSGRPFLWVARPGLAGGEDQYFPEGFKERVGDRGKVVGWAPQQEVLAHPAVGCFVSHCGWNSTMEGIASGVPFLCWPYYGDQFPNRDYICEEWRTGLSLQALEGVSVVTAEEIKEKLKMLLEDKGIRERALQLKEAARRSIGEGGASYENFQRLAEVLKGGDDHRP